ncbi:MULTISPECIES: low-specificity L-threonine aldolase [unclassified Fusibacter]|uniref:low-specificity L-threonine aldolase n=1 Tax=unclassified Fusibacter TaxID=2624464 RepID=UPI001013BCDF|nr:MULTISPECIES: low-specificity L-threonine aldolase [unclassified Fusibacter]MCK8061015.1 low-specificity L-threonine aldolase [Fusibacter sp. A2]NPE20531.1 low-specificity L-threonine aldolase [Fusibacter sp. A1]RXV63729.1 low-specificity L-threonine aldolase [Fusibacter sp. A1]
MMIDLRSDTVTKPTDKMRNAMANALVGDDVYGDDLTTIELERTAADLLGKEAALFVPSGTFGNQLAILTHTRRGDEIIVGHDSHIVLHEVGAAAVIAGVQLRATTTKNGVFNVDEVKSLIRTDDIHYPDTGLICMENAHGNGTVVPLENMEAIYGIAKEHAIPLHLDGARIFNAAAVLGVDVKTIAEYTDSVNVCLSKGLCAPIGSVLAGSENFIARARKNRKLMGGGMRQTGILAAAGLIAMKEMPVFLKGDHAKAERLAHALDAITNIDVIWERRDISMVFFTLPESVINETNFVEGLRQKGIIINGTEDKEYRFVTHHWISDEDIVKIVEAVKSLIG